MEYNIEYFQLTPKTGVWYVTLGDDIVCQVSKEETALSIKRVFEDNNVYTMQNYNSLPWGIRRGFIIATTTDRPNLKY